MVFIVMLIAVKHATAAGTHSATSSLNLVGSNRIVNRNSNISSTKGKSSFIQSTPTGRGSHAIGYVDGDDDASCWEAMLVRPPVIRRARWQAGLIRSRPGPY